MRISNLFHPQPLTTIAGSLTPRLPMFPCAAINCATIAPMLEHPYTAVSVPAVSALWRHEHSRTRPDDADCGIDRTPEDFAGYEPDWRGDRTLAPVRGDAPRGRDGDVDDLSWGRIDDGGFDGGNDGLFRTILDLVDRFFALFNPVDRTATAKAGALAYINH